MKNILDLTRNLLNLSKIAKYKTKYLRWHVDNTARISYKNILAKDKCILTIDKGTIVEGRIVFEKERANISIGKNTFIGASSIISSKKIAIGDDVLIAWGCTIIDHDSHAVSFNKRKNDVKNWYRGKKDWKHVNSKAIKINNKAWIGFNTIILKGVTIGEGAVIGAGSVVTKSIPPFTLAAGNPAKVIKLL